MSNATKMIDELIQADGISNNDLFMVSIRQGNGYVSRKINLQTLKNYVLNGVEVQINNQNKTISENGTYTCDQNQGFTGLGTVTVNVPAVNNQSLTVTENGTYHPDPNRTGFNPVIVNVSGGLVIVGDDDTGKNLRVRDGLLCLLDTKVQPSNNTQIGLYGLSMSNGADSTRYVEQAQNVSYYLKGFNNPGTGFRPLYFHIATDDYPFGSDYHWKVRDLIITHYEGQPTSSNSSGWVAFAPVQGLGLSITINYGIANQQTATVVDGAWRIS